MADDNSFSLGTLGTGVAPQITPNAIQSQRALALALQKAGMSTEPIRSPWQGVGRIAQSVFGGLEEYQANKQESDQRKDYARHIAGAMDENIPMEERRQHVAAAFGSPVGNPELTKSIAPYGLPHPVESPLGIKYYDPLNPSKEVGSVNKTALGTVKAGDVEMPNITQGTGGGTGGQNVPIQQAPFPTFGPNGRMQGNLTSAQGQSPAPPVGAVGTQQAGPIPPQIVQAKRQVNQLEAEKKGEMTSAEENVKRYADVHKGIAGTGMIGASQIQNYDLMDQIQKMPNFSPGSGSETGLAFQRLAARFGINPNAAAPREVFNQVSAKLLANQFDQIKTLASQSGETGARIFKPMLDLEEKANITPGDSLEGIKAKLKIGRAVSEQSMKYADMADDYASAHGGRLDAGFEKSIRKEISGARVPNVFGAGQPAAAAQPTMTHSRADIEAELARRAAQKTAP